MATNSIIASIDEEIRKLQQARSLLAETLSADGRRRVGRPKGSTKATASGRRPALSAEARAKIAAAQRKRWTAAKRAKA